MIPGLELFDILKKEKKKGKKLRSKWNFKRCRSLVVTNNGGTEKMKLIRREITIIFQVLLEDKKGVLIRILDGERSKRHKGNHFLTFLLAYDSHVLKMFR